MTRMKRAMSRALKKESLMNNMALYMVNSLSPKTVYWLYDSIKEQDIIVSIKVPNTFLNRFLVCALNLMSKFSCVEEIKSSGEEYISIKQLGFEFCNNYSEEEGFHWAS